MAANTYTYTQHQLVETDGLNIRALLSRYSSLWPWFLLSIGLMLGIGYLYLLNKQPTYKIQASLLVQDQQKGSEQSSSLKELGVFAHKQVVENEIEILRSFTLMNRVAEKLHLDVRYFQNTTFGKQEIYTDSPVELTIESGRPELYKKPLVVVLQNDKYIKLNDQTYPVNKFIETPYGRIKLQTKKQPIDSTLSYSIQATKRSTSVKNYLTNLHAIPTGKGSTVILLSLEDAVPAKGEAILNQLIREYNEAAIMDKNKVTASTLKFIEDRLTIVSGELASAEKNVEQYKSHQGITDLSTQAQTFLQTVQQNDALLNQVQIQLATLNDLQKYIEGKSDNKGSTPAVVGLSDPVLLSLINGLTQLEQQRNHLLHTTSELNPLLETVDSQIRLTKNNMASTILTMKNMLLSTQRQYIDKNGSVEGAIRTIPQKERVLMDITRQQAIKNSLYTYLLQKREETAVAFASTMADTRTIDTALSEDEPVRPNKSIIFALFGLLGLVIPVTVVASSDALNNRVTRRVDVEEITQVPILGELARKRQKGSLVITPKGQSVIAEQIRTIRACLPSLRNEATESQILLFTSSISGEGKSFVSINLGMSLAYVNKPTVILDMDLRAPKLHKVFELNNTIGISDYLQGESTLDDVLTPVPGSTNYYVITSGNIPNNPSELLSSPRLNQLIDELRERFDYILIDTPPVGLVSDARIIAPFVDTTFFMVRHNVTPKNHLRMIDKLRMDNSFPRLNIILNAVDGNDAYQYSNSHNEDYVYGQSRKKKWMLS